MLIFFSNDPIVWKILQDIQEFCKEIFSQYFTRKWFIFIYKKITETRKPFVVALRQGRRVLYTVRTLQNYPSATTKYLRRASQVSANSRNPKQLARNFSTSRNRGNNESLTPSACKWRRHPGRPVNIQFPWRMPLGQLIPLSGSWNMLRTSEVGLMSSLCREGNEGAPDKQNSIMASGWKPPSKILHWKNVVNTKFVYK